MYMYESFAFKRVTDFTHETNVFILHYTRLICITPKGKLVSSLRHTSHKMKIM